MSSIPEDNKKAVTDPEIIKKQQEIQKEATKRELEEVAKIRFEHHQIKRMRKLQAINNVAEQAAAKKKMEKEMAEKEYYNKQQGSTMNVSKTLDARSEFGSPTGRNSKYKEKLGRMIATTKTP